MGLSTGFDHEPWGPRALLLLAAVAVPGFGVIARFAAPSYEVGFPMRFAIAGLAGAVWLLSAREGWVRQNVRGLAIGVACWVFVYFQLRAAQSGFALGQSSQLLICAVTVMLFRRPRELVAYLVFVVAVTLATTLGAEHPPLPLPLLLATFCTVIVGIGLVALSRVRLEQDLRDARTLLEQRVAERTAALSHEVEVRRAAERDALRASRAKSRFLANMGHELRTPLNAIVGFSELVQEELADLDRPDLVADLGRVVHSAGQLLHLVSDVMDLSRIEAGRLEVLEQDVDVEALLADLFRLVETDRRRSGSELDVRVTPGTRVCTDPARLSQIGLNLVTNALKFTACGRVAVTAERMGATFVLEVADTGVGIAAEDLERIFDRFAQLDDSSTRRHDGCGLGLSLSRDLARRLGGDLTVRSELGVGSTFTLELPA